MLFIIILLYYILSNLATGFPREKSSKTGYICSCNEHGDLDLGWRSGSSRLHLQEKELSISGAQGSLLAETSGSITSHLPHPAVPFTKLVLWNFIITVVNLITKCITDILTKSWIMTNCVRKQRYLLEFIMKIWDS